MSKITENIHKVLHESWNISRTEKNKLLLNDNNLKVEQVEKAGGGQNLGIFKILKSSKSYIVKLPKDTDFDNEPENVKFNNLKDFVKLNNSKLGFPHIVKYKNTFEVQDEDKKSQMILLEKACGESMDIFLQKSANDEQILSDMKIIVKQMVNFWQCSGRLEFATDSNEWQFLGNVHGDLTNFGNIFYSKNDKKVSFIDYSDLTTQTSIANELTQLLYGVETALKESTLLQEENIFKLMSYVSNEIKSGFILNIREIN